MLQENAIKLLSKVPLLFVLIYYLIIQNNLFCQHFPKQ